jgi:peptide/nickel transport system ATP-binding protein
VVFVTHDIAAAAEVADRIAVMYAGRIVEEGPVAAMLRAPRHPYTLALLRSRADGALAKGTRLETIPGAPPDLSALPAGCAFASRCRLAADACRASATRAGAAVARPPGAVPAPRCHVARHSLRIKP